jgi:hypothetical protein
MLRHKELESECHLVRSHCVLPICTAFVRDTKAIPEPNIVRLSVPDVGKLDLRLDDKVAILNEKKDVALPTAVPIDTAKRADDISSEPAMLYTRVSEPQQVHWLVV